MAYTNCSLISDVLSDAFGSYWYRTWITSGGAQLATDGQTFSWGGDDDIGGIGGGITVPAEILKYTPEQELQLTVDSSGSASYGGHDYLLSGWIRCDEDTGMATFIPKGTTYITPASVWYQLYVPIWSRCDWTISFDLNGGDGTTPASRPVVRGQPYGALPEVSRQGYVFEGWFDGVVDTPVSPTDIYTQMRDLMLTAHWRLPSASLAILDPMGGTIAGNYFVQCHEGQPYGTLPTPTKPGCTFLGWFTAGTGGTQVTSSTIVTATSNHTLYAHWSAGADTATVYFNATGGTVSPSSKTATVGAAIGALPTPTFQNHTFLGWFASTVGSDQVTAATIMPDGDLILYAHWSADTVTVSFNANGGTVSPASASFAIGGQYVGMPRPVRSGYNFLGWFTAATGGTQIMPSTTVTTTTSHTLYAHWSPGSVPWWGVTFG